MKDFKKGYKIILWVFSLILILTIPLIIWVSSLGLSDLIAALIGLCALIISIIALGISDKKIPEIDFSIWVWKKETEKVDDYYGTTFRVVNNSSQPINDAVITIKLPSNVLKLPPEYDKGHFKKITYGKTDILNTDFFRYFSSETDNNVISFEAQIKLKDKQWSNENRKIYFTVSGQNMKAKTIIINKDGFKEILSSSFKNQANFHN